MSLYNRSIGRRGIMLVRSTDILHFFSFCMKQFHVNYDSQSITLKLSRYVRTSAFSDTVNPTIRMLRPKSVFHRRGGVSGDVFSRF